MYTPVTAAILELSGLAVLLIYLSQAYGCDVQILLHVHFGDKRAILGIGCDKYSCGIGMYTSMILACTPRWKGVILKTFCLHLNCGRVAKYTCKFMGYNSFRLI